MSYFTIEQGTLLRYCGEEEHVTLPSTVEKIKDDAFPPDAPIKTLHIPASVVRIDPRALEYLRLESITVSPDNKIYHSDRNCLIETKAKALIRGCKNSVIPDDGSVTSIRDFAFRHCAGLAAITLPAPIAEIGPGAFEHCADLATVALPDGIAKIPEKAFRHCAALRQITFPKSITHIDAEAFSHCQSLTYVKLPAAVQRIDPSAFAGCTALHVFQAPQPLTGGENDVFSAGESPFSTTAESIPSPFTVSDSQKENPFVSADKEKSNRTQ